MTVKYMIFTNRERFTVNESGHIGRPEIKMEPSGQWFVLGLVCRNNFGHTIHYVPFKEWTPEKLATIKWTYKNGKPRYTLRDLDHGTTREWGTNRVNRVSTFA